MWQDSAIKKLLKIFLFIFSIYFTIKIFFKNSLICFDSQNKERRKQETHYYASKVGISIVPARFQPISAISVIGRYGPIMAELAWFSANPKKKKKA